MKQKVVPVEQPAQPIGKAGSPWLRTAAIQQITILQPRELYSTRYESCRHTCQASTQNEPRTYANFPTHVSILSVTSDTYATVNAAKSMLTGLSGFLTCHEHSQHEHMEPNTHYDSHGTGRRSRIFFMIIGVGVGLHVFLLAMFGNTCIHTRAHLVERRTIT